MDVTEVVRAAGGVVTRRRRDGAVDVLVVHRPAYDDWSFPKGKLEPGEREDVAALREVEEETGLRCRLGGEVGVTHYRDRRGRPKSARYWAMTPLEGEGDPQPANEVDEVRWVALADAQSLLSYPRDRELLAGLEDAL